MALFAAAWSVTACAVGTEDSGPDFGGATPAGSGAGSTTGDEATSTITASGSTTADETTTGEPPPPPDGSTGDADDGGSTGGGAVACVEQDCAAGDFIGLVSGDEQSDELTREGWQPAWVKFGVTEDNHSIAGEDLSVSIYLVSPPDIEFDITALRGPEGSSASCQGSPTLASGDADAPRH